MAQELLFGDLANGNSGSLNRDDEMSRSYTIHDGGKSLIPLARVPSAPGSLKDHKWVSVNILDDGRPGD